MFYSAELLSLRKKGKLSRCWLAGTLSDRLFKKTVSNKIVLSIDIQVTCNEILKFINSKNGNRYSRFSLYMSAQLMFGAVKLFRIQATLFQDSLFKIKADLNPIDLAPKRKKRTSEITLHDDPMIDPPPIEFGDLQREDQHLLREAHLEMLGDPAFRDYVASPNFGALTDEEFGSILLNEGDIRLFAALDAHGRTIDESREQPRSPGHATDAQNLGLSDALPAIEESANAEITAEGISTSRKRLSDAINLDTPTKKPRRGLGQETDAHAEEKHEDVTANFPAGFSRHDEFAGIPPQEIRPRDTTVDPPADEPSPRIDESIRLPPEAPADPALLPQEHTADMRVPVDSNFHLESLESETPRAPRVRRGRVIRQIDEVTVLPDSMIGKSLYGNPSVHTIEWIPPVTDRERGILAAALLLNPTTNFRCSGASDSSRWAQQLLPDFAKRTMGPFIAENDGSMSAEAIRFAESGTQTGSVEISKGHAETTGLEPSSRNKTVEEPIPVDFESMAGPMVPEMPGNVPELPRDIPLANITDEPMLANISEDQEVNLPPEIEVPPIAQNVVEDPSGAATVTCDTKLLQSDVRESVTANEKSGSDPNTGDADAFLPPKLRRKSFGKRETQKKSTSSEAIVEICDSPASIRSQQSEIQSTWNVPELMAYLEILWHDNPVVNFAELLPPNETRRIDAAVCFNLLLQLSKNGKVVLQQSETYGAIRISKKIAGQ